MYEVLINLGVGGRGNQFSKKWRGRQGKKGHSRAWFWGCFFFVVVGGGGGGVFGGFSGFGGFGGFGCFLLGRCKIKKEILKRGRVVPHKFVRD